MLIYYFSYDVNKYQHLSPPKAWTLLVQFLNVYWWKRHEKKVTTSMGVGVGVCVSGGTTYPCI